MDSINDKMPLTPDHNKERLQQLKALMPDLFTNEGKLNSKELQKLIDPDSINEVERYEFRWFGKSQSKREAFTPTDATLVFDKDRSINPTETENIIIEGENLQVLKLLSKGYRDKIKCIYIDPPYNTGKDFVYSDSWKQDRKEYWEDEEVLENGLKVDTNADTDGRYHSNWLNMMYSRLLIARQLLRDDGVIFISIDDNEVHHLRKLCDEVFGEENFLSEVVWHSKYTTSNDAKYLSSQHEYVIIYSKSKDTFDVGLLDRTEKMDAAYKNPDGDEKGRWKATPLHAKSGSDSGIYEITFPNGIKWTSPKGAYPRYAKDKLLDFYNEKRLHFNSKGGIDKKTYLSEVKKGKTVGTIWNYKEVGSSHQANEEIASLLGKGIFDNPKSIRLLQNCLKVANGTESIILDFFGGSGTTAQAVTELNQSDGGNRKYILVQLPEATDPKSEAHKAGYKKISDITIERNKRVIDKILQEKADHEANIKKLNKENKAFQKEISKSQKANPTLPLEGAGDDKAITKLKKKITKNEAEITTAKEAIEKIEQLDKGFKVFQLVKSNFPRVEFAPDREKTEEENMELFQKYIRDKESQLVNVFNKDALFTEILIKQGFELNYTLTKQEKFSKNEIFLATDGKKETLICLDINIEEETVEFFKKNKERRLIVLERALDTTKKWNFKHFMGDEKFLAF